MNQEHHFIERRKYPRTKKQLALKIKAEGYDIVTQTENISCIGTYCSVDRNIPVMTKLSLIFLLPLKKKSGDATTKIQCKGVVVRSENAAEPGKFNIAIFFNEITERSKNKIAQYVNQFINP